MTNETFQRRVLRALFTVLGLWAITATCHAQNYYMATRSVTLSGATDKVTIQQPASGARNVRFKGALVSCSVACTITLSQNGTTASTTALAVTPLNLSPTPAALAFSASNAGNGTTIATYPIAASDIGRKWIELGPSCTTCNDGFTLAPGPNSNLSIAVSSISGDFFVAIYFTEI